MRLAGKVALVTGGSGGLGEAICLELAREGADVAVHYFSNREAATRVATAVEDLGRRAIVVPGDLSREDGARLLARTVAAEFGRLDILVNNAAVIEQDEDDYWSEAAWDGILAVNVRGPVLAVHACRELLDDAGGVVVNISSAAAYGGKGAYAASKAALNAITRWLALELAPRIRVVGVAPGYVEAGMNAGATPEKWQDVARRTPLGRNGKPVDVARAVAFMASQDAGWITGETLLVSGGRLLRP